MNQLPKIDLKKIEMCPLREITPTVEITRYIFGKEYSRPNKNDPGFVRIKKTAIAPNTNDDGEYETSVMATDGCSEDQIDKIGKEHVARIREEELVAYVRVLSAPVFESSLKVIHDQNGHDLHCVIKGWPPQKERMLAKANDLADAITKHASKIFKEF